MKSISRFRNVCLVAVAVLTAACSNGGAVSNASPRVGEVPTQNTTGGTAFSLDLSSYVSDREGATLAYSVVSVGGSFAGSTNSPRPHRGPLPNQRISFAIFISAAASIFNAPDISTAASCAANPANLLRPTRNGCPVNSEIASTIFRSNPALLLIPVPTAVPPIGSSYK